MMNRLWSYLVNPFIYMFLELFLHSKRVEILE